MSKESLFNNETLMGLYVLGISVWGGLVSYFDKATQFSWARLFAHLCSASFAGFMTALLCEAANVSSVPITGVLSGVAAHMGTPALIKLLMKSKTVRQFLEDGEDSLNKKGK